MKLVLCIVFACLAASSIGVQNEISFVSPTLSRAIETNDARILEAEITDMLECFRTVLSAGLPAHGIPSFNPLEIPELNIDLDSLGIPEATGFLNFKNLVLGGTMGFEATHIKGTLVVIGGLGAQVEVTLLFDNINFKSDYIADLQVSGIHVFGEGDVTLDVTNLQLEVVLKVRLTAPTTARIYLEEMTFLPSVENVHIEFTGLFNDEEQSQMVNDLLNSILTNWVNEKAQDISDLIETIIKNIINNAEPGEPSEDPSLIEIILNECKDEPITTTRDPITTTPPINDCRDPSGPLESVACQIVEAIEDVQKLLDTIDPLNTENVDIGAILPGEVDWVLKKLGLAGFSEFILGAVQVEVIRVAGVGMAANVTIPFSWNVIDLDITQNGEFDILGMNIKLKDSKVMGFVQNFDFTVNLLINVLTQKLADLSLKPSIAENDIKGICSGIFINDVDASDFLTSFINNELARFVAKHGEDVGDIIAAIILKLIANRPEDPAVAKLADTIAQIENIIHRYSEHLIL